MKHRVALLLVVLLFVITPSTFAQSPQRGVSIAPIPAATGTWGAYHALIIGINDYKEWPRLQTAVKDATVLRDILVSRYGFDKKNVILRTDSKASRHQITRDLRYLAKSMRKTDNLFVYYAGHGQLDDFTGDGYWVPAEGALKDPDTWVSNSLIKAVLSSEKLQAKNVIVIADSCYSGSMLRGGPSLLSLDDQRYREKLVEKASLRSRQVISSGGIEPVTDGGSEGHSLFAFYLINALKKNDREVIDLENLFHTRVWKPVTEIGDQRPNVGRLKTPMDQDGQFVLYNAAWVKEHAQNQAALDAKKQEQARQQTAVASAELELQRQRFEMEKQKLAYEKEQLAQQKALELERLKFENQKQDFEYAKLQAQLEEMKQKSKSRAAETERLQNEKQNREQENAKLETQLKEIKPEQQKKQPMIASVSPAVFDQRRSNSRRALKTQYKLALFPLEVHALPNRGTKDKGDSVYANVVSNVARDDHQLLIKYSTTDLETILKKDGIEIWKKSSIFSESKPDWKEVRNLCQKIGADVAVLGGARYGGGATIDIYLYDSSSEKIYSKMKGNISGLTFKQSVSQIVNDLMKEFYRHQ
jgi:uncharacterized caspase-like protein